MTINWNKRKYSKEEFIKAWNDSVSVAQVGEILGCNKSGSGYYTLLSAAEDLGLSKDHMLGRAWSRGISNSNAPKRELAEILVINSTYTSTSSLKKRLIAEGILENKCSECKQLPVWNGKPLVLQLDHINGIRRDNRLENLRILCGHCHSQTTTYCSRNRNNAGLVESRHTREPQKLLGVKSHASSSLATRTCKDCGSNISKRSNRCKSCVAKKQRTKIEWPSNEELLKLLSVHNYTQLAKILGVSDNAIRKRLKNIR